MSILQITTYTWLCWNWVGLQCRAIYMYGLRVSTCSLCRDTLKRLLVTSGRDWWITSVRTPRCQGAFATYWKNQSQPRILNSFQLVCENFTICWFDQEALHCYQRLDNFLLLKMIHQFLREKIDCFKVFLPEVSFWLGKLMRVTVFLVPFYTLATQALQYSISQL